MQLMSCSGAAPNGNACDGGYPSAALEWVVTNKGQTSEAMDPFQMKMTQCTEAQAADTIDNVVTLPSGSTLDVLKVWLLLQMFCTCRTSQNVLLPDSVKSLQRTSASSCFQAVHPVLTLCISMLH